MSKEITCSNCSSTFTFTRIGDQRGQKRQLCDTCQPSAEKIRYDRWLAVDPETRKVSRRISIQQKLFYAATERAKKKGLPFDIEMSDIVIPETCPVFGMPLVAGTSGKGFMAANNAPTLDRIKPELGYVKGNIQVISWRANKLKSDGTLEELQAVAAWLEKVCLN